MADLNIFARWHGEGIKAGTDQAKGQFAGLASYAKTALGAVGVGIGIAALVGGLRAVNTELIRDTTAFQQLGNAVRRFGGASEDIDRIRRTISGLSPAIAKEDEAIAAAFSALLIVTGKVDEAEKNLSLTLDIMAARQMDAAGAAKLVGMAQAGYMMQLTRFLPDIKEFASANSKLQGTAEGAAFAMRILGERFRGFGAEYARTAAGSIDALRIAWMELWKEMLGGEEGIKSGISWVKAFSDALIEIRREWQSNKNLLNDVPSYEERRRGPRAAGLLTMPTVSTTAQRYGQYDAFGFGVSPDTGPQKPPDYMKFDEKSGRWWDTRQIAGPRERLFTERASGLPRYGKGGFPAGLDMTEATDTAWKKVAEQDHSEAERLRRHYEQVGHLITQTLNGAFHASEKGAKGLAEYVRQTLKDAAMQGLAGGIGGIIVSGMTGGAAGGFLPGLAGAFGLNASWRGERI